MYTIVVNELANDLRADYEQARRIPQEEEWPPNLPTSIVSVALIHYKSIRTEQELIEISGRFKKGAPAVDMLASKDSRVTKDITKIFSVVDGEADPPKRILIEGAPGIGKTILAKEIAYCWAKNTLMEKQKLLFLVYFRDPRVHKVNSIKDLLELFTINNAPEDLEKYVKESKGKNVVFIFDGFDEYPATLQHESLITDIIKCKNEGKLLQNSIVVVTSRPTATLFLHNLVNRRIEILGFAKEDRDKYISLLLGDSPEEIQKLDIYLKLHPNIDGLCFIPLHLAILLFLFQRKTLPETLTEMNESFIVHSIFRHLTKETLNLIENYEVKKLEDLPEGIYNFLQKLSKLAFNGLQNDQLVFSYDEIRKVFPEVNTIPGAVNGFGLLQAVQHYVPKGAGRTTSFNFLHFTMQEYLAALYVSKLSYQHIFSLMKDTFWKGQYSFMWMMHIGIVGVKSSAFISLVYPEAFDVSSSGEVVDHNNWKISQHILNDKRKLLHLFQCYIEAKAGKQPEAVSSIFSSGSIQLTDVPLLPHHISSLMFFMSTVSKQQWRALDLRNCNLRNIGMNSLLEHVVKSEKNTSTLEYVDLSENGSSSWGVYCAIIRYCCVNSLTLCGDDGMEEYVKEITDSLETSTTLKSLTLFSIGRTGLESIEMVLVQNTTLREVTLSHTKHRRDFKYLHCFQCTRYRKAEDSAIILKLLYDSCYTVSAEIANLSGGFIRNDTVMLTTFSLLFTNIKTLDVSCCKLNEFGIATIVDCLKVKCSLQKLDLSENKILATGAEKLSEIFFLATTLQTLDISKCSIPESGLKAICLVLENNKNLQDLNISCNKMTIQGAKSMAKVIKTNTTLQSLNISNCGIPDDGVVVISESCKVNTTLKELVVSWDNDKVKVNTAKKVWKFSKKQLDKTGTLIVSNILCANRMVRELHISNNHMMYEAIIECLECNSWLQELDMSYNKMPKKAKQIAQQIAKVIQVNKSLQKLDISYCGVPDDGAVVISESYKYSITLQELVLSWKKDEVTVNTADFSCSLSNKKIGNTGAQIVCNLLCNSNVSIKNLDISNNEISDEGMFAISDCLRNSYTLQRLNISRNIISCKGAKELADAIQINFRLQSLNISSCNIPDDGLVVVSNCIKKKGNFIALNLSHNKITSKGVIKEVAEIIQVNTMLLKLDISYCGIPDDGALVISESYKNNTTLQELKMSLNNKVNFCTSYKDFNLSKKIIDYKSAQILANLLCNNTKVRTLDISNCKLSGSKLAVIISNCIVKNISLQELNMSHNVIDIALANMIAEAISINKTLLKLDISYCDVPDSGAVVISESFKNNITLQEVIISLKTVRISTGDPSCNLFDQNIDNTRVQIVSNLLCNKIVKILDLDISNNQISDDGVLPISDCLRQNNTLQHLNMSHNNISVKGAKELADVIQVNKTLRSLDISYCGIPEEGALVISESYKNNKTLKELIMSWEDAICINIANSLCDLSDKGVDNVVVKIISKGLENKNVKITNLNLSYNQISDDGVLSICECLRQNNTLQHLNMSHNTISVKGAKELADVIQVNKTLRSLDISYCGIPDNGIVVISESYKSSKTLQNLIVSWNNNQSFVNTGVLSCDVANTKLRNTGVQLLCNFLYNNFVKIKLLNISSNQISDDGTLIISGYLKDIDTLQQLNMSHNKISVNGAKILADAIQANATLQILDISYCGISDDGVVDISDGLKNNNSLQTLKMSHNKITSKGPKALAEAIQVNTTLQTLDISYCGIPDDGVVVISESCKNNKTLQKLIISWKSSQDDTVVIDIGQDKCCDLANKKIDNIGAQIVSNFFSFSVKTTKLNISKNNISSDGVVTISECLTNNKSLQELNLSHNIIAADGANMIAGAITMNKTLEEIDISHNNVSGDGIIAISNCIIKNTTLKVLNISHNAIDKERATALAEAISINKTLARIDISHCGIPDEGTLAIGEAVKNNNGLKCLNMSYNEIKIDGAKMVAKAIQVNKTLLKLDISYCCIPDDGAVIISQSCFPTLQELIVSWNSKNYLINFKKTSVLYDLSRKDIGNTGAIIISNILCYNFAVRNLCISHNNISYDGVVAICNFLMTDHYLHELDMSHNEITSRGADEVANALQQNKTLQKLDISNCGIPDSGALVISESYRSNRMLEELVISWENNDVVSTTNAVWNLSSNIEAHIASNLLHKNWTVNEVHISCSNISNDGVIAMSICLRNITSLHKLTFLKGTINIDGCEMIAEVIQSNTTLQQLHIFECHIPDEGAIVISESYKNTKTLKELKISWNKDSVTVSTTDPILDLSNKNIGTIGLIVISNLLRGKCKILELDLSSNSLGDDGISVITKCLKTNKTLKILSLKNNGITSKGINMIFDAIWLNETLETLDISFNYIGTDGAVKICKYLKVKGTLEHLHVAGISKQERIIVWGAQKYKNKCRVYYE